MGPLSGGGIGRALIINNLLPTQSLVKENERQLPFVEDLAVVTY